MKRKVATPEELVHFCAIEHAIALRIAQHSRGKKQVQQYSQRAALFTQLAAAVGAALVNHDTIIGMQKALHSAEHKQLATLHARRA